jgi:hypothetical protein
MSPGFTILSNLKNRYKQIRTVEIILVINFCCTDSLQQPIRAEREFYNTANYIRFTWNRCFRNQVPSAWIT